MSIEAEVINQLPAVRERSMKREWQRRTRRQFVVENGFSTAADYAVGGQRKQILERDGYRCVDCGMTDDEHKVRWKRPITIDHVDKDRSNNSPDNLKTRCLTCHGRKDLLPRLRVQRIHKHEATIRAARAAGKTYQSIADDIGFSIGRVYTVCKQWGIV